MKPDFLYSPFSPLEKRNDKNNTAPSYRIKKGSALGRVPRHFPSRAIARWPDCGKCKTLIKLVRYCLLAQHLTLTLNRHSCCLLLLLCKCTCSNMLIKFPVFFLTHSVSLHLKFYHIFLYHQGIVSILMALL